MDQTDVKILKCLRADARENASLISEKIGMSVSAVIDRIRKMENNGLIECHTTIINHRKAGKDVVAILRWRWSIPGTAMISVPQWSSSPRCWSATLSPVSSII